MRRGEPKARLHSDGRKSDVEIRLPTLNAPARSAGRDDFLDPSPRIGKATVGQPGGVIREAHADRCLAFNMTSPIGSPWDIRS
jgi:hypothetical protein